MDDKTKIGLAAVALTAVIVAAVLIATIRIQSTGNIVTIGLSSSINQIDWGEMYPNSTKAISFDVTNTGSKSGTIHMSTVDMPNYLGIWWDGEDKFLHPLETVQVTIVLNAYTNATQGAFSFNIVLLLNAEEAN